jgi:hypothetical protein
LRRVNWLIAFLLLLQCLAASAIPRSAVAHARFTVGAVAFSEGYDCAADKLGGDKTPAHLVHSLCCILCSSDLSDKTSSFFATLIAPAEFWAPEAAITITARNLGDANGNPPGWATSWSSRAPPSFS